MTQQTPQQHRRDGAPEANAAVDFYDRNCRSKPFLECGIRINVLQTRCDTMLRKHMLGLLT